MIFYLFLILTVRIKFTMDHLQPLSQAQIAERIAALRKKKGFSQEELAKQLGISRSSFTQLELGNRSLSAQELQQMGMLLGFSLDDFMSSQFSVLSAPPASKAAAEQASTERISVPKLQVAKFKNVLLYMLERCAGKPNVGETVLYKLLYFADFNYYELYEEQMTGASYRKLPFGPVPQKLDGILQQMMEDRELERIKTEYRGYAQTRYLPLCKADLTLLKASEKEVIDRVIEQMSEWSASMISEYSHGDKPWKATGDGEEINYELAFYRRPPYSVRVYEAEEQY